ncbi:MAG: hypothetical protein K2J17_02070 [Paramuribaculum sp.]|nr:hypothetical protein [Paramuribaculum sp.]
MNKFMRVAIIAATISLGASAQGPGGPRLGSVPKGPALDKSGDVELQALIKSEIPKFEVKKWYDAVSGDTVHYNIFTPTGDGPFPVLLYISDASTPGEDMTRPLWQGVGGLIWTTDESQYETPCFVIVPQFPTVAVDDNYYRTNYVDAVARMIQDFSKNPKVDAGRMYTTGQSMGGMISMYYAWAYPDLFAASLFVDSHWNITTFPEIVRHKFIWVTAGESGKAWPEIVPMEQAAEAQGIPYSYQRWSAKLPQEQQDSLAAAMLAKGAPVNIINFAPGSVLREDGSGSEHMLSFDYAYRLRPVRQWLFHQSK